MLEKKIEGSNNEYIVNERGCEVENENKKVEI